MKLLDLFALSDGQLQEYAGKAAFQRGLAYIQQARVSHIERGQHKVSTSVRGTQTYSVSLQLTQGKLHWQCDCPVGIEADFCKHVVAVALSVRGDVPAAPDVGKDLLVFLRSQSVAILSQKLFSYTHQFKEIEKDLTFWHKSSQVGSTAELNKVIGGLLRTGSFIDYNKSYDYAQRVRQIAELLDGLARSQPQRCADAAEYALLRLFSVLGRCDDSAGVIGEAIADVVQAHHAAFSLAAMDAKEKSQHFFKLIKADGWSFIRFENYQSILGKEACALYGLMLEKACANLPTQRSPDRHIFTEADAERSHLLRLLQDWYRHEGDVDALLSLKARHVSQAYDYCEIVDLCNQHLRSKQALEWAERGHRAFPDDARLSELLISCYRHDGCDDEAEKLAWELFEKQPWVERYVWLLKQAKKSQFASWQQRAMVYLCEVEERDLARRKLRDPVALRNVTMRVSILLHENQITEAVTIATGATLSNHVALLLADQARKLHPDISIRIYRPEIFQQASLGGNNSYQQAYALLEKLLPLLAESEAKVLLNELRTRFKAKRNFIALIAPL
ncbi:MAG: hypothetical protein HOP01_02540 [Gallionella sp.]|nr:hypothetical protein [Gallionella sp.]